MILVLLRLIFKQGRHIRGGPAEEGKFVYSVHKYQMPNGTLDSGDPLVG